MAIITVRSTLSADVKTNDNKSKPRSLSMLSSIAAMMPDQRVEMQNHGHEHLSPTPITTEDSTEGIRKPKRSAYLSRSLSRSFSSRNLSQAATAKSLSPQSRKRKKHHQSEQSFFSQGTRRRSVSLGSCRSSSAHAALLGMSKREESSEKLTEMDSEERKVALGVSDSPIAEQISTIDATLHSRADEICNNLYRSHEIELPDSCAMGRIVTNDIITKMNEKIVDDYNYDVVSSTPLHIPPRLPTASESFAIAEKSKEEKTNWGWYA